jgi:hypothetical protein
MVFPYTGLFIAANCNSRFSHGLYTRSYGTVSSIGLLGQNCKPYSNDAYPQDANWTLVGEIYYP